MRVVCSLSSRGLPSTHTEVPHERYDAIACATHVHIASHDCLQTMAMKDWAGVMGAVADQLAGTRCVKHGGLVRTTTGADSR